MKTNYQTVLDNMLKDNPKDSKLLLHSCCGPCSSYVLTYLLDYFDITVFYYNPNIYPEDEYQKRLTEQIKLINALNDKKIKILTLPYNNQEFTNKVTGLETEKEGGKRCTLCYQLRLEQTAKYAKEHNFDYFGTTLSVSPYKHSDILNNIGSMLEKKYQIKYLYSDFKKKDGYKKSIELSKKYNLYRQNYCGCQFSLQEMAKIK